MVEIEFSTIPDAEVDLRVLSELLADFSKQTGIRVRIHPMTWGTAWADMVAFASHGRGPDLSHLGGTWVSSLAVMNALRPFTQNEVGEIGGSNAFLSAAWQSGVLLGDTHVWAIPWTAYIYVVCYRKDLLRQIGIQSERAFENGSTVLETIKQLRQSSLEMGWLIPYVPPPYSDLVHIAACYIWEAGGHYVDETGQKVVFDQPEALQGLRTWLEIYRAVPPAYAHLSITDVRTLFLQGRAAAILADNRFAASALSEEAEPHLRENLGLAAVSSVPWCGGGSFVIWHHTQGYPERARAAVQLIQYLTSREAQLRWGREVRHMPARSDIHDELYPPGAPLHLASVAARAGRAYRSVPLWRRLEYQIAQALNDCIQEGRENPARDSDEILQSHLAPLAQRLNLTLQG